MISPEKRSIEQILGGTRIRYSVPSYQRSYDWGKGELQELIDDLKQIKGDPDNKLFLGNFIFDVSDEEAYEIVDGQQRMTTMSILFIALREHAKKLNEVEIASEIQKYISIYSKIRGKNEVKFSVSTNIRDVYNYMADPEWDGYFIEKVDGKSVKRQINRLKPIYKFIAESIQDYNVSDLNEFITALWDAYVVVIQVENTQDVFAVFERTNARGLDLNIGDLLKNYIFSYQQEGFEDKWTDIVDNADGSLPRMLKYFWVSRKGYIQQSKLYRSIKSYVQELDDHEDQEGIVVFVKDLYAFSRYYKTINSLDPEHTRDWLDEIELFDISQNEDYYARIARVFQALKLFRVTQPVPIIYSLIMLYKKATDRKPEWLLSTLEAIEKYHFVNNVISGRVGNEVEKYYADEAARFYSLKENVNTEFTSFKRGLVGKKALRDEFISNFIETVVYSGKNIGLINYVFDRINNYKVKGGQYVTIYAPEKDLKRRNYNIEHLLAQSHKKKYTEEEKEKFDQIGNLIVISRHTNSQLGDKSPSEKIELIRADKKHYGNLRYVDDFIEEYENEFANWNLDIIDKRSIAVARNAYEKVWQF